MSGKKKSGVDIDLGNRCSKRAYELSKLTFKNREGKSGAAMMSVDGLFSNMLQFGEERIGISSDGIGTKIELAERTGIYNTLGYDLLAMVADDLAAGGFVPANISNIIDADFLDYEIIDALMTGLKNACDECSVSISGGEIAELGPRIGGYGDNMHCNWSSTAIGVLHKNLTSPLDGSALNSGDAVLALKSDGFRSNGFSLIRKTLENRYGDYWHTEKFENSLLGEVLLTPSRIYSPFITSLMDSEIIPTSVIHITGGGIADNFSRVLKSKKLGADLNNLFEPHSIMNELMNLASIDNQFSYRYWNMGNGMLVTLNQSEAEKALKIADQMNYSAKIAGSVNSSGIISIQNAGVSYNVEE
jgi:phosphoribosylformylglycinamidine cyclo-ligase